MAESRNRGVYDRLVKSWPVVVTVGCGLIWIGRLQTPEQVDERIRVGLRPLQIRDEWFEKELLRHEQLVDEIRRIEERLHKLEPK